MLDAFFGTQTTYIANERGTVRMGNRDGEGGEVEEMVAGDEDFVAVWGEVIIIDELWRINNYFFCKSEAGFAKEF